MIEFVTNNWVAIGVAVAAVMKAADIIAKMTPTETDNKWIAMVRRVVKVIGLIPDDNPGKAK